MYNMVDYSVMLRLLAVLGNYIHELAGHVPDKTNSRIYSHNAPTTYSLRRR